MEVVSHLSGGKNKQGKVRVRLGTCGKVREGGRGGGPGGSIPSDSEWRVGGVVEGRVIYCALCTSAVLPGASGTGCARTQY